jgi:hypothetical protein
MQSIGMVDDHTAYCFRAQVSPSYAAS